MYGIFAYIGVVSGVNVGIYSIHGVSSGIGLIVFTKQPFLDSGLHRLQNPFFNL